MQRKVNLNKVGKRKDFQITAHNVAFRVGKCGVTIQMKPMVLSFLRLSVAVTVESVDGSLSVAIRMKVIEQYFPVVLFVLLCSVVLNLLVSTVLRVYMTFLKCFLTLGLPE